MKKNSITLLILMIAFTSAVNAQQTTLQAQAVNNANGTKQITITDASGKVTIITAADDATLKTKYLDFIKQQAAENTPATADPKPQIISHRAVLGINGKQQIMVTFSTGKEVTIDAVEGQAIQETYLSYLKKEGLACGCSPVAAPADSGANTHTATRNASVIHQ